MNRVVIGSLLLSLLPVVAGSSVAMADSSPAAQDGITVNLVALNGSGCPAGSTKVKASNDKTSFTVEYGDYTAALGNGIATTDRRKNCQMSVLVDVPQGFTYSISSADYRGSAWLTDGATAVERANYYFQGSADNQTSTNTLSGPYSGDWHFTDTTADADLVWAPCGESRILNINTSLRVSGSDSGDAGFISMDSTKYKARTLFHVSWKQC